jgi:hypothetical protein
MEPQRVPKKGSTWDSPKDYTKRDTPRERWTETTKEPGTGRPLDYPTASPTATELVSQMATQMATQMETLSLSRSRSP